MAGGRPRMADWTSADGQRRKVGEMGSALARSRSLGRLLDPGLVVVLFSLGLPTTLAITCISEKKDVRRRGRWAGARARA